MFFSRKLDAHLRFCKSILSVFFIILLTDFSFGQTMVFTQTDTDATIGIDRKAFVGLGNTSLHSDGYAHDFTLPARTNPCEQITAISVDINLTGYANTGGCPHSLLYYNLFYGCTPYAGGASCLPSTNLIAEPNFAPNTSPPTFNFGNPLGSPLNPNIVQDFGENFSVDIIPVTNPGCNSVSNGDISYQYTITVKVTVTNLSPTIPTFTAVSPICAGDTLSALPTISNNGITGTWSPALDNATTTTYTFTPSPSECALPTDLTITVNQVPLQPVIACYETATFNTSTCSWEITGTQPVQPPIVNCWDNYVFNTTTCVWDNTGSQPVQPTLACYETATFNTSTCSWEITGTQPVQPPVVNCWDNYVFNTATCVWDNTGSQPVQPTLACYETATFNPSTCSWEITGTQPLPPILECWETAAFNTTTCLWEVSGTQPGNTTEENLDLCVGSTLTLLPQTNIPNPSFAWNTGEFTSQLVIDTPGVYTVEITGGVCSFETIIYNISLVETPIIDNVVSDGNDIIITTSNIGDFEYSLDGNSFQTNNIFYDVEGGLYNIYVKQQNCDDTASIEHLHFYIPKFFTPNGDGVNDRFNLSGIEFFNSSEVSIFNRYGKLLKFARNSTFSWDGTYGGERLTSDDYWYVIIIESQKFTGHFTLKR